MCNRAKIILLLPLLPLLVSARPLPPDGYTKEGHCIVRTKAQRRLGMLRFETAQEAKRYCNKTMVFLFREHRCRTFHTEGMRFSIEIRAGGRRKTVGPGKRVRVCGKRVVETVK